MWTPTRKHRLILSLLLVLLAVFCSEWMFKDLFAKVTPAGKQWLRYGIHLLQGIFIALAVAVWWMRGRLRMAICLALLLSLELLVLGVEFHYSQMYGVARQVIRGLRLSLLLGCLVMLWRGQSHRVWLRRYLLIAAFFCFELLTIAPDALVSIPVAYTAQLMGISGYFFYAMATCLYIASLWSTLAVMHVSLWYVRVLAYLMFIVSMTILLTYRDFSFHITAETVELILKEMQFASHYKGVAVSAAGKYILAGVVFVVLFELLLHRWVPRFRPRVLLFASMAWMLCFHLHQQTRTTFLSPLFKISILPPVALLHEQPKVQRERVGINPITRPVVRNIVLIVDESTTGERFTINGYPVPTTPYLASHPKKYINFGIASSGFTRTYMSHAFLQAGVRVEQVAKIASGQLKLDVRTLPTLFQYAKRIGMSTHFIDGPSYQRGRGLVQLTDLKRYIDEVVKIKKKYRPIKLAYIDSRVADELVRILKTKPKQYKFIYIKKNGTHYPFEGRYPRSEVHFKPCLSPYRMRAFQVGNDVELGKRVMRSHHNALRWSTDSFFKRLIPMIEKLPQSTLVFYTSDHGHALEGCKWRNYCWYDNMQSSVPLITFPFHVPQALKQELQQASALNHNRLSHFEIFPTILQLMGYTKDRVKARYGLSFFDKVRKPRYQVHGRYSATGDGERSGNNKFNLKPFKPTDLRKYIVR